jgi:hypothetical protein
MRVETRSPNPWVRLLIGVAAAAVVLSPGIRRADADESGPCAQAKDAAKKAVASAPARSGEQKPTATAPAEAPRAIVRVISIPLQECPADDNEGMNAVKAFIDPATGELRAPTPEEQTALARAIAPKAVRVSPAEKVAMVLANGIVTYEIGEDGMQDVVVRAGADGKPVFLCTPRSETPRALTRPLAPKTGNPASEEK